MRQSCLLALGLIPAAFAGASNAATNDREVARFLEHCPAASASFEGSYAPTLTYDRWTVTHDGATGTAASRPESVRLGQWPRAVLSNVQAGSLRAQSLSGTSKSTGRRWSAWIGLGPECLVLEGSDSTLAGGGATLAMSADGNRRELAAGGKTTLFERRDEQGAATPTDKPENAACTDPLECQSGKCEGVIPTAFCAAP